VQQVEALQARRTNVGFGRVAIEAEGLLNTLIEEEPLVAALPCGSELAGAKTLTRAPWRARTPHRSAARRPSAR
jgi:hypothetical protein